MMESFWATLQLEVPRPEEMETHDEVATAIFEWIECWFNLMRWHFSIGMHSPVEFEQPTPRLITTVDPTPRVSGLRGEPHRGLQGWPTTGKNTPTSSNAAITCGRSD